VFNLSKCPRCGYRLNMQPREEVRKDYPNAFLPWTPTEDRTLADMVGAGASRLAITEALHRQLGSILRRMEKLGLEEHPKAAAAAAVGAAAPETIREASQRAEEEEMARLGVLA